jgi:hypothetical protein
MKKFVTLAMPRGGRLLYWSQPDGHVWEMLTVSYARQQRA